MLRKESKEILANSRDRGWVLEPEAKHLLSLAGLNVPKYVWVKSFEDPARFVNQIGYPVVAKVVSPQLLHKSDRGGVVVGIDTDAKLEEVFRQFSAFEGFDGILVEEMLSGVELIIGAKIDYQFGPMILLGIGGTGVEIYRDTSLRMAPLCQDDVQSMVSALKARPLLEGYRGTEPVNLGELTLMILAFSDLVMELEEFVESIDLNPVMCSADTCVVADARIVLRKELIPE
jgi:acetate---CoA ligase (ADP-forming) subunit beta